MFASVSVCDNKCTYIRQAQSTPQGTFIHVWVEEIPQKLIPELQSSATVSLNFSIFINLLQHVDLLVALWFLWRPHGFQYIQSDIISHFYTSDQTPQAFSGIYLFNQTSVLKNSPNLKMVQNNPHFCRWCKQVRCVVVKATLTCWPGHCGPHLTIAVSHGCHAKWHIDPLSSFYHTQRAGTIGSTAQDPATSQVDLELSTHMAVPVWLTRFFFKHLFVSLSS